MADSIAGIAKSLLAGDVLHRQRSVQSLQLGYARQGVQLLRERGRGGTQIHKTAILLRLRKDAVRIPIRILQLLLRKAIREYGIGRFHAIGKFEARRLQGFGKDLADGTVPVKCE